MSDIIYGINPVTETLKTRASQIKKIILDKEKDVRKLNILIGLAQREKVHVEYKQRRFLDQTSGDKRHQGVLAIVSHRREVGLNEIIKSWQESGEKLLTLILDGIQDPQNMGALVRTASFL